MQITLHRFHVILIQQKSLKNFENQHQFIFDCLMLDSAKFRVKKEDPKFSLGFIAYFPTPTHMNFELLKEY